jgi:hypothetical protein
MTSSTPNTPTPQASTTASTAVKQATPDLQIFNEIAIPVEIMTDLVFEDIGGQELINISRHDLINGIDVLYQPIKNISMLYFTWNPNNILKLQDASLDYFKNFPIQLSKKIPQCGTGYDYDYESEVKSPNCNIVYIDPITGSLVINVTNMEKSEQVEVQIFNSIDLSDGTIYTEDIS